MKALRIIFRFFGLGLYVLGPIINIGKKCFQQIYSEKMKFTITNADKTSSFTPFIHVYGAKYIRVGKSTSIGSNVIIAAWDKKRTGINNTPKIIIGNNCSIGKGCHITAINNITIGDDALFGQYILITDNSHGRNQAEEMLIPPGKRQVFSKGPVIIGSRVWIGDKVSIMPNVTIGDEVIIAANSVVTKNIPPRCVVAGIPAEIVKTIN